MAAPFLSTISLSRSFAQDDMADVIEKLVGTYIDLRIEDERFIDTVKRLGIEPFKTSVYGNKKEIAEVENV